jgi:DNA-binding SARP family transcriptional activator/outer membrane protein assembly factor BamB
VAIGLLGPLHVDGAAGLTPRDRVVLAALAIHAGAVLPPERLADALWTQGPPRSWRKIVQGCVLRLRAAVGGAAIETLPGGYRLALAADDIDAHRFERLIERGRDLLDAGEPDRAAVALRAGLSLWRGSPLSDLPSWPPAQVEAARLEELRRRAQEDLVAAGLATDPDVAAATVLVAEEPLREHRWALLAQALYLTGRQAEALAELRRARDLLRHELGLDPGAELQAVEGAILRHDPALEVRSRSLHGGCPYKGLAVYDTADAPWFFGREEETAACLRALAESPLLVVVGPSGSGKSSLMRAGIIPALAERGCPAELVTPVAGPAGFPADRAVAVDQLEELFTAGRPPDAVEAFLARLVEIAEAGHPVVTTLRADHVGGLATVPAFARLAERGLHLLAPMTGEQLRAAIERPAEVAGARLEPGLVEVLLRDVRDETGGLPLLSHALAGTWHRREGRTLTVEGYAATGGIRGAVARTADRLYDSLPESQRAVLRDLLLRLVVPAEDGEPVPTRVSWETLGADPARRDVLMQLARARLVTVDADAVAIAHEALARAWPRLRGWLSEDAAGRRALRHLTLATGEWVQRGRPDSELYRGARLTDAVERGPRDLTRLEREFLDASIARARAAEAAEKVRVRQQARQNRRLRVAVVAVAGLLVLALAAGGLAVHQRGEAVRTAADAQVDRLVAESAALRGSRRDLAALLAVEAHQRRPGASTAGALLGVVTSAPGFLGYLPVADGPARSGALLPDGRTLIAVGPGAVAAAVDLDSGDVRRTFPSPGLAADGAAAAVSADGRTAATIAWQGSEVRGGRSVLGVFDVATGSRQLPEIEPALDAGGVAVSVDGRHVAVSGGRAGRVIVVDVGSGHIVEVPPVPEAVSERVRTTAALAFGPDGALVVGSPTGVLRVVDPAAGSVLQELTGASAGTSDAIAAVVSNGREIVSAGARGVVRWDRGTGRPVWVRPLDPGGCERAVVAEVAGAVLCADATGRVLALDLATGWPTGERYDLHRGPISALLLGADGSTLVEFGAEQPVLARWRLDRAGPLGRRLPVADSPRGYNSDGRLLAVAGRADVTVVDAVSGATVRTLVGYTHPVWTVDPERIVVFEDRDGTGHVVDVRTGRSVLQLDGGFGEPPHGTGPGGAVVVAWGVSESSDTVIMWDTRTGEYAGRVLGRSGKRASISPDGAVVAVVWPEQRRMVTRDAANGTQLAERSGVVSAAFGPAGLVAISTPDGRLDFLERGTLAVVGPPVTGIPGPVEQYAYSADGHLLAVRGSDGDVWLVDVAARALLGGPIPLEGPAEGLAMRPDGAELAVGSDDRVVLWDLRPEAWVQAACRVAGRDLTEAERRDHIGEVPTAPTCP